MKMAKSLTLHFAALLCTTSTAQADTFGSGANTFEIEFVTIGDPGNAADTTGNPNPAGSVDYVYRIGKFEVSEDIIDKANVQSALDSNPLNLTHDNRGANRPATSVSWFEAARFVNWLNTSTGSTPAYKFDEDGSFQLWTVSDAGYDPNNRYRNGLADYFLPSVDEWYKAAYYDPNRGVYYDFPTGSDTPPTPVASGTAADTAVYDQFHGPASITQAGGLSRYGTMGQGGNVWEWDETDFDMVNDSPSSGRGLRGGVWYDFSDFLSSSLRGMAFPAVDDGDGFGFRVASIPEPSSLLLGALASLGLLSRARRRSAA